MQFPKSGHLVVSTASNHIAVQGRYHIAQWSKKFEILYPGTNNLFVYESLESVYHTPLHTVTEPNHSSFFGFP